MKIYIMLLVASYYIQQEIYKQDYTIIATCTSFKVRKCHRFWSKCVYDLWKDSKRALDGTPPDLSQILIAIPNCAATFC